MAAHVLTALQQIIENPSREFEHLPSALDISCWTEDLSFLDHEELAELAYNGDVDGVEGWAYSHREKYYNEWVRLGRPETREEWREARYGG